MQLTPNIRIKVRISKEKKGEPFFYIFWDFFIDGSPYGRSSPFPLSLS
jgi:hypothetical protein